jgi:hypothetical protein
VPIRAVLPLLALAAALYACGADWHEYRSAEGKFAVELPSKTVVTREVNDGASVVNFISVEVEGHAYRVGWQDIAAPGKPVAEILSDAQATVLRKLDAGLTQASEIKYGSAPGRAFTALGANGVTLSVRLYAVGTRPMRLYQLIAAVPDPARGERDVKRFFDSFKLID